MKIHKCLAGCGQIITWRFAICNECEAKYGKSSKNWPEWLRFLWKEEQRERRRNKKVRKHEISIVDLEEPLER